MTQEYPSIGCYNLGIRKNGTVFILSKKFRLTLAHRNNLPIWERYQTKSDKTEIAVHAENLSMWVYETVIE